MEQQMKNEGGGESHACTHATNTCCAPGGHHHRGCRVLAAVIVLVGVFSVGFAFGELRSYHQQIDGWEHYPQVPMMGQQGYRANPTSGGMMERRGVVGENAVQLNSTTTENSPSLP